MVLDITSFRPNEDPDALGPEGVREIQRQRNKDVGVVDEIIAADEKWREARFKADKFNTVKRVCSNAIKAKFKTKEAPGDEAEPVPAALVERIADLSADDVKDLTINQLKKMSKECDTAKESNNQLMEQLDESRTSLLRSVGNVLAEDCPKFDDEKDNVVVHTHGNVKDRKKYSHVDLIEMIDGVDMERGAVTAGNRGYYLKGPGLALEMALVIYSHHFLAKRGFTGLSPPVFMRKEVMQEVAQLSQFDDELYKVVGRASEDENDRGTKEAYLIATAEQPVAAYHRDEWLDVETFPLKYCGISECFRQEVGSRGRDTRGIFRVHQFKKVEQFVLTAPDKSWAMMDEMLGNAKDFMESIGLPYQVINIVSGALNLAAAKKLDVEAWFPGSGAFRELVSCSNCTDYQARRLKVRYGRTKKQNETVKFAHMLNSTLCATTRNICCILENFQVGDFGDEVGGVVVPEVLRQYMPDEYKDFIPFVREAPIIEEQRKEAEKKGKGGKGKKADKSKAKK